MKRFDFTGEPCPDKPEDGLLVAVTDPRQMHHFDCPKGHMFTIGELRRLARPCSNPQCPEAGDCGGECARTF